MSNSSVVSAFLMIGYPVINIGAVYAIVRIDNWFLLSPVYLVLLGLAMPLVALAALWIFSLNSATGGKSYILPGLATVAILLSGGLHFFISSIAAASV